MTKKITPRFIFVFVLTLAVFNFLPLLLLAATPEPPGLVTCGTGTAGPSDCTWPKLVEMFNKVTKFIFIDLMIPLAVIAIVYAGIQILLKKSQPADLIKEKGALRNVAIGIFMALGAYAIVKSILTMLGGSNSGVLQEAMKQVFGN
jgi:hypothetical protein